MTKEEIKNVLPHREPMLLVDEIFVEEDGSVEARYRIPQQPFYCDGHFPGRPIVPGVILCEMMAQSCSMLFPEILKENLGVYRGLDGVRFRGEVHPGDLCVIHCTLVKRKGSVFVCSADLMVAEKKCCEAKITLAAVPKN